MVTGSKIKYLTLYYTGRYMEILIYSEAIVVICKSAQF